MLRWRAIAFVGLAVGRADVRKESLWIDSIMVSQEADNPLLKATFDLNCDLELCNPAVQEAFRRRNSNGNNAYVLRSVSSA